MAFQNFVPAQFAAGVERELETLHVYAEDTNRKYEGDIRELGDQVKILGIGKVTVKDMPSNTINGLADPEQIEDQSQFLKITERKYFNYAIGDIDMAFAREDGIKEAVQSETSEALADVQDQFIADLIKASTVEKLYSTGTTGFTVGTTKKARAVLDEAVAKLYKNNVKKNTKIVATVPVDFYMKLKEEVLNLDTDNSKLLKNGFVGQYGNIYIKMSNVQAVDGSNTLVHVKTQRALAFARKVTHVEAYRPEKGFADAIKGYVLYGGKVVRPKEIVAIAVAGYN